MKRSIAWGFLALMAIMFSACKKDDKFPDYKGFVKAIHADSSMVVVGSILSGEDIIMVCRTMNEKSPGFMYKVDKKGSLVWRKQISSVMHIIWQVYDEPGDGFFILGTEPGSNRMMTVVHYTNDAELQYSRQIPWKIPLGGLWGFSPVQMLKLNSGGYVFTTSMNCDFNVLYTNNAMDSTTLIQKRIPLPSSPQWGYGTFPRGIVELPDSTIMATTSYTYSQTGDFNWKTLVYRLDLNGNVKSMETIGDSLHNEMPAVLLPMGKDLFLITGRMGMAHDGSGIFINYLNNSMGYLCSGEINLLRLSARGELIARRSVRDYPANGLILNARPTSDGGYILCGTVDQSTMLSIISPTKIYLLKVSPNGNYEWSRTFVTTYASYGVEAVQTKDGGYFITGYEKSFDSHFNPIVIKTDANGNI